MVVFAANNNVLFRMFTNLRGSTGGRKMQASCWMRSPGFTPLCSNTAGKISRRRGAVFFHFLFFLQILNPESLRVQFCMIFK